MASTTPNGGMKVRALIPNEAGELVETDLWLTLDETKMIGSEVGGFSIAGQEPPDARIGETDA